MNTQHEPHNHTALGHEPENGLATETRHRIGSLIAVMLGFELVALITILQAVSVHA